MSISKTKSRNELRRQRLADRLVRQTEDYLNGHGGNLAPAWPHHANGKRPGANRRKPGKQSLAANGSRVLDVRRLGAATWKISLLASANGKFDNKRIRLATDQLSDFLDGLQAVRVIMDLSEIQSCSVLLLHLIAHAHRRVSNNRGRLALCRARTDINHLIQASVLRGLVCCYDTVELALKACHA